MSTSTRLRQLADRMGLDGFAEELREIAGELEAKAAPAVPQGNDPAWTLAAKVREALDRKACPGYYMDVAVEAVVNNYAPAAPSQEPAAWVPHLVDRADGVKGHYAIGRWNPRGFREVWNLHTHRWAAYSDDVMSLEEADSLLRQITIPTIAPAPSQPSKYGSPELQALIVAHATQPVTLTDEGARRVALSIIEDLEGRKGVLDDVDDDVKQEMLDSFAETIIAALREKDGK